MNSRHILHIALITALILLMPLIAMQFTDQVLWELNDFIIAGILLFGAGVGFKCFMMSKVNAISKKVAYVVITLLFFILIWMELAVGIFGTPWAGS